MKPCNLKKGNNMTNVVNMQSSKSNQWVKCPSCISSFFFRFNTNVDEAI